MTDEDKFDWDRFGAAFDRIFRDKEDDDEDQNTEDTSEPSPSS
jgi:hypothetical protein